MDYDSQMRTNPSYAENTPNGKTQDVRLELCLCFAHHVRVCDLKLVGSNLIGDGIV